MPTINKPKAKTKTPSGGLRAIRQSIYNTRRWQKLRARQLKAQPLCAICQEEGRTTQAQHVHHIKSFTSAPTRSERCALAYDPNNLESLCEACHVRLHNRRGAAKARAERNDEQRAPIGAASSTDTEVLGGRGSNFRASPPVNPATYRNTRPEVFEVSEGLKNSLEAPAEVSALPRFVPPSGLLAATRAEIGRISEQLSAQGALTEADFTALTVLALTLDRYRRAVVIVGRDGALVFDRAGKPQRHPLIKVAADAQIQVLKLLQEFGLTPKSRERIKALQSGGEEVDPLQEFLSMVNKK